MWLQPGGLFNPLPHQVITSTVFRSGAIGSSEIEHHGRSSNGGGQLHTYESDWVAASNFLAIVKWDGTQGSFTSLGTFACTVVHGDVMSTEITDNGLVGAALVVTIVCKQNGSTLGTVQDSFAISGTNAFATGTCGLGWDDGGAQNGSLGWQDFSAVTS